MAGDEYTSVVGGGLKLKGSKPSGVMKKKKKAKVAKVDKTIAEDDQSSSGKKSGSLDDTITEEELTRLEEEAYGQEDRKTETERKYEEMKRKRV